MNKVDILSKQDVRKASLSLSSLSLSSLSLPGHYHGVGPLVETFSSHTSRSFFNGLSWFLVPSAM
jgi:hypothetical protein